MNIKTKTAFIAIVTLVLGIAIGMMISPLKKDPSKSATTKRSGRSSHDYVSHLKRVILPEETQQDTVENVLRRHKETLDKMSSAYKQNMNMTTEALRRELSAILTQEQQERLDKHFEKREKRRKGRHGKHSQWDSSRVKNDD